MKHPIFLIAVAMSCLIAIACEEQRATTIVPILGTNQKVNYTYRFRSKERQPNRQRQSGGRRRCGTTLSQRPPGGIPSS